MKTETFTIPKLRQKKEQGEKITIVTCYDYTFARILEGCDVDCVLVGDSLGMVVQGKETTLPVTIDEIIYHTQMVKRGLSHPLLIADMPFLSYQTCPEEALHHAGRLLKESEAQAVKLEGGEELADTIERMVAIGIPVMGHIGLQPQSVHAMGGYQVQGKKKEDVKRLYREAQVLEEAGITALVLEGIRSEVAAKITEMLSIPTIGIGSGPHCDGQVLVLYDLLGMDKSFKPKFVRRYAELEDTITEAVNHYARDIRSGDFPSNAESFSIKSYSALLSKKKK